MAPIGPAWQPLRNLHPRLLDALLALAVFGGLLVEGATVQLPGALLTSVPLAWRRQEPLVVFFLVLLGVAFSAGVAPYAAIAAAMIATYSVGAYSRHRLLSLVVILATGGTIVYAYGGRLPSVPDYSGPFILLVPMWLVGNAIHNWHLRAGALQERAKLLEQGQEHATQMALANERARITRELHDVVAHSVSVMIVQAGAARQVLRTGPEQASEALLAVESTGRQAMTELRNLLGLLSQDGSGVDLAPQPGVEQLDSLIQRVSEAGLPICFHVEGHARPLPPGVDLTAYRIVQEALTNALKHSGLAPTEVVLEYRETELKVEVLDEGAGVVTRTEGERGRGLAGMKERVALYGGTLEAGPRLERGYAVRAWLPLK